MRKGSRRVKRQISTLPTWVPWAAAGVGVAALIYGVSRMEAVQDFFSDLTDSISDSFDSFSGNDDFDESDEEYGSSNGFSDYSSANSGNADYGSTGAGGL